MDRYFAGLFCAASLVATLGVGCTPEPTPTAVIPTVTATVQSTPTSAASTTAPTTATRVQTPSPAVSPTSTVPPTPGAKQNLLAAYDAALPKIKAYRSKVILDITRQDSPERIIEVILPDRFRQIQDTDVRQLGNRAYFVEAGMIRTVPGLLPMFERVYLPWYRDQFAQAAQATFLGRSVIDGVQLVGYQTTAKIAGTNISDPVTFNKPVDQPIKVWFSPANGFPVRMEVGQPLIYINVYYDINGKIDEIGPP